MHPAIETWDTGVFLGANCYHEPRGVLLVGHLDFLSTQCGLDEWEQRVELGRSDELTAVKHGYRPCRRCYGLT